MNNNIGVIAVLTGFGISLVSGNPYSIAFCGTCLIITVVVNIARKC